MKPELLGKIQKTVAELKEEKVVLAKHVASLRK